MPGAVYESANYLWGQPPSIDRDRDAVIAGLTLPWSSGACEGTVNRIKMLMRQMFGRAGFPLLRKRVLLA
jgi:transposase